ncbi:MAG: ABC transporter permease [Chitinophagaceae bacterium]
MDRPLVEFRWLRRLLGATALLWSLWIFCTGIDYFGYSNHLDIRVYYPLYFCFALIIIWAAAAAFLRPKAAVTAQTGASNTSAIPDELRAKGESLKRLVETNLYYQDPELTLGSLAEKLNLHPKELSRIINSALKINFNDFINGYRVRDAARKMQDPAYHHITLLGIAFDAGFNSKTSFNRIFREMTGKSPTAYKNQLKNKRPSHDLGRGRLPELLILNREPLKRWVPGKLNSHFMFRNYFKTTFRNLLRYKLFSGLNIFGLATGMACSLLILLWVRDELNYDQFNTNADHIFRVTDKASDQEYVTVPPSLAYAIQSTIPSIKIATRVASIQKMITIGGKKFNEKNIYYADSNFLQLFNYPLLKGTVANVLSSPYSVVLTEAIAKKYFGSANTAMGKTIYIDNDIQGSTLLVTGVLKNIPSNSHLQPNLLIPMALYDKVNNTKYGWTNFDVYTYFRLKDAIAPTQGNLDNINQQINAIYKQNNSEFAAAFSSQPLTRIHLHSHFSMDVPGQGSYVYVTIFSVAAIFIILIACINFMNLATAISGQRAKEVGLRKTVGALRQQLVMQFIFESVLIAFISLLLAVGMVYVMLPLFNQLAAKNISFNPFRANIFIILVGIAFLSGLLSGSYPAFYLSSFNPVKALKGAKILSSNKSFLRNGLVVLQFSISIILMVSTLVIYNQLQFIQNRDIGFNKENLLYMEMPQVGDLKNNKDAMQATLTSYPDVTSYTFTDHLPTNLSDGISMLSWPGMNSGTQIEAYRLRVDENFARTFDMKIMAGRFFSKDFGGDDSSFVVNEAALKVMHMKPEDAIGQSITYWDETAPIIGVVKDFNFRPVQQPIDPMILKSNFSGGFVVMRTTPATVQKVISSFQKSFKNVYGDYPFSYGFVNEDLSKLYTNEQRMGKLITIFSILSIVISCLGLFGLATFAAKQRVKEIGIRKVLGAGETGIVLLLSKDLIRLVILSFVIAFPAAGWAMSKWLQSFAYRITISPWIFLLAGLTALFIAFVTVSFQAIKAAIANPVKSLRTE